MVAAWRILSGGLLLFLLFSLGSFTTSSSAAPACLNEAARTGPSVTLPDCRAYELVTPADSNGRELQALLPFFGFGGQTYDQFPVELASATKGTFVYETYGGPLESPGGANGIFDVYRAERQAEGWETTQRLSRTPVGLLPPVPGGMSPDHAFSFQDEEAVSYLRNPQGEFELTGIGSLGEEPHAQGRYVSAGGGHVIFTTGKKWSGNKPEQSGWCSEGAPDASCKILKLEPDAPPTGTGAVYDRSADGPTHVVSLLPSDNAPAAGEQAFYKGVSEDGTAVAFTIGPEPGKGTMYVRLDNAKTLEVAAGPPTFAGLSNDGHYLLYVTGGTIHRFDTELETDAEINPIGEASIVNVSADGSHVYFISEQQLDGVKGTAGEPNLYLWKGGAPIYITTVAASDLESTSGSAAKYPALTNWTGWVANPPGEGFDQGPGADSSRATPDGTVLVFESRAQLTPYDNAGHSEIYRYDGGDGSLECLSCNPNGVEAEGYARLQALQRVGNRIVLHNVSADGSRVFFESSEALVAEDTDGINDIYEWHEEGGSPSLSLISSGKSAAYILPPNASPFPLPDAIPLPNLLLSITPDGSDVFFTANEPLAPGAGENGTQGIYDARAGGGFAIPGEAAPCAEEGCRPSPLGAAVAFPAPRSEGLDGNGNLKPGKRRCHRSDHAKGKKRPCARHRRGGAQRSSSSASQPTAPDAGPPGPSASASALGAQLDPQLAAGSLTGSLVGEGEGSGIKEFKGNTAPADAGAHPDFTTVIAFETIKTESGRETPEQSSEDISISLPPGLLGDPLAAPRCETGTFVVLGLRPGEECPTDSQVGITSVRVGLPLFETAHEPVYNLTPPHPGQELARFGFIAISYPVFIDVKVRTASDYGVTATVHGAPGLGAVVRATTTLWGNPAGEEHDDERLTPREANLCPKGNPCEVGGSRHSGILPAEQKAFMTNPSACQEGQVGLEVTAYQLPGQLFTASAPLAPITDCAGLPFAPEFSADPTSQVAGAPTGLKTKLVIPQHLGAEERATSTMREARVTLPAGMQVAAGAANWIGTCSEEQVGYHHEVDTHCPDNSKLGTATIISPAIATPIEGAIYQRSPSPGHQLGLWLTADALGLHIKLPGELEPDPQTGRLTAVFKDLPQVPVEEIDLNVWGGPRAPLQNPDHCGSFATDFTFTPHSDDPAVVGHSDMQITEGCNQPFAPTLHAGVTEPVAGKFSPFVFDLTRPDSDQALRGFSLKLPEGELAKIKGVPLCGDAAAAAASCPGDSRIGSLKATAGPGPDPFTLPEPGKAEPQIYLSGPYQGSPFSIVSQVPAQAGPFDLGVLAVRSGLDVEPETGIAVVKADPLPQFFEGVGIAYRNLHAVIDRPEFNLNPTDCSELQVSAEATSTQGAVAHPSARFQVDGCKALKFKPKLSLKLRGGTKRAQYPALTAVLKARKGDANIAFTSVALPHSEFLAQEHIGTICTRVQFAADKCPKGSVYGSAKAITPLLDQPLSGPVYLRSSNHPLPDLVAKLGGQLEIDLVGRIDSVHGGIRATFESVPDAPVTKFVLQMKGGAKSLITNSTDICRGSRRATAQLKAQNGRAARLRPVLVAGGCGGKKKRSPKHHR